MSDGGFTYQLSVKYGPTGDYMLNLRANTEEEFIEVLAAADRQALFIGAVAEDVRAGGVAAQPVAGPPQVAAPVHAQPEAAHSYAQPQTAPAAQPQASTGGGYCGPNGSHGPRVRRTGGAGADTWAGWFCPLQKTDPNRCKPTYDR